MGRRDASRARLQPAHDTAVSSRIKVDSWRDRISSAPAIGFVLNRARYWRAKGRRPPAAGRHKSGANTNEVTAAAAAAARLAPSQAPNRNKSIGAAQIKQRQGCRRRRRRRRSRGQKSGGKSASEKERAARARRPMIIINHATSRRRRARAGRRQKGARPSQLIRHANEGGREEPHSLAPARRPSPVACRAAGLLSAGHLGTGQLTAPGERRPDLIELLARPASGLGATGAHCLSAGRAAPPAAAAAAAAARMGLLI